MPASAAPDEGMTMGVPVPGRGRNGCADLVPGVEAVPLEGQGAEGLPPRFDQIQVRGVFGLEDELPAGMRQGEEQDIGGAVGAQVVQNGVDPLYVRSDPALHLFQEGDEVGGGASGGRPRARRAGGRLEGAEDLALSPPAIVDLLRGALGGALGHVDEVVAREALRRFRTHLVETDDATACGSSRVESFDGPLFSAQLGSTRSPNQISSFRHRRPSATRSSSMLLRFMVMPFSSATWAAKRSSVQEAKERPRVCGSVSAVAITTLTCSRVYVGGRPLRGLSASPASPPSFSR